MVGAGITDNGTAYAGQLFSSILSHSIGSGSAIIEQNSNPISGNNVLQRATACLSMIVPCPATTVGNWVMQMAVFRDASWTVSGGWSPARPAQVRYADQFPGSTADAQIANAIADLGATGGIVETSGLGPTQTWTSAPFIGANSSGALVTVKLCSTTVTSSVQIHQPANVKVHGCGKDTTIITFTGLSNTQDLWTVLFSSNTNTFANLSGVTIDGGAACSGGPCGQDGLVVAGGNHPVFQDLKIVNTYRDCVHLEPDVGYHWIQNPSFYDLETTTCGRDGLRLQVSADLEYINGLTIVNWQGRGVGQIQAGTQMGEGHNIHAEVDYDSGNDAIANFTCVGCLTDSQAKATSNSSIYIYDKATCGSCQTKVEFWTFLNGGSESTTSIPTAQLFQIAQSGSQSKFTQTFRFYAYINSNYEPQKGCADPGTHANAGGTIWCDMATTGSVPEFDNGINFLNYSNPNPFDIYVGPAIGPSSNEFQIGTAGSGEALRLPNGFVRTAQGASANTDLAWEVTETANQYTATYVFQNAYYIHPICTATDVSNPQVLQPVYTTQNGLIYSVSYSTDSAGDTLDGSCIGR